jgi:hypothetical protein
MRFRSGQIFFELAPIEDADVEEPQGGDVETHGPDRQLLLREQVSLVASERIRPEPIDPAASVILLAGAERM